MSAYRLPSPYERPPLQRRASGLALALGANLLLLLVLLGLGVKHELPRPSPPSFIVDLVPEAKQSTAEPTKTAASRKPPPPAAKAKPVPKPPPIVLPAKPAEPNKPLDMVEMSKEDYAATDIGKLKGSGSGGDGDSEGVGHGANGETLYAAEWARHPTPAELQAYLPASAPEGWGLIACKTMPDDRVDDCYELDQFPHGSHLASAVRQAAWQFRVRPPRRNGRPMVGEWVQIRIDYIHMGGGQ